jgi:hypothetical protein
MIVSPSIPFIHLGIYPKMRNLKSFPMFHKPLVELERVCYNIIVITHPYAKCAKSGKMRVWEKQNLKR